MMAFLGAEGFPRSICLHFSAGAAAAAGSAVAAAGSAAAAAAAANILPGWAPRWLGNLLSIFPFFCLFWWLTSLFPLP